MKKQEQHRILELQQEKIYHKVVAKNEVGEVSKTAEIIATRIFLESISLNKTEEKVSEGKTTTLIATVKPDNATTKKTVRWESSDTTIATVSDTGGSDRKRKWEM